MILGIETSCDETSAAVLNGKEESPRLESLVILSQDVHRVFGGVVPELASRAHLTSIVPVAERALAADSAFSCCMSPSAFVRQLRRGTIPWP